MNKKDLILFWEDKIRKIMVEWYDSSWINNEVYAIQNHLRDNEDFGDLTHTQQKTILAYVKKKYRKR